MCIREVVPAINPSTATRPLVRMIFGPQGSGKTTVRLLAQRNTQGRGWGKSTTWFTLDAAEVGKNIAHFQSFLWRNAGTVTRIAYNQESYLRARFHLDFTAGDLADMLLVKAVTGLVSGSVTSRPSRLKPESAACLARLANTYYGGSNETLVNFTALLRVTPLADDATIERKEVKVVPPSASPVYECPTMEDNGDMGPLKTFLRLSKEMSVGDLVFSLDGLSDNALFRGDSGSRAVKALVKAASDPTFVDILNAEKISFWIFVPGAVDSILEKETRERLSDSEHVIVDLTYDVADLLRIADQRFSTYQTCANRVTNPSVAGGHSFWASWGFAKDFYDVPCPRTFRDLFCNVQEKDWVEEAVTKACWLKTPRQILAVFREVVRLLASEKPVDSTSPRSFCISEDLFIKALRDLKRSESLS
ncbi:hypothetical protein M427DRAFT_222901 [Gonapodya prolifera JEL478]|uniref:Uncharacterized protein n=1 Tax=Gonapodya prolifera (strain JEL478) TaxID=1344416 RepID=A0A139AMZ7_GONPJ|nr:hypothetical protein M427DRAFT_222901 [Gonapodya prolifera JEL478]|eukprot:KXS18141.1 hypothetical protein M427DRAFT_222901 [Gonapodya prolifera JEL478]